MDATEGLRSQYVAQLAMLEDCIRLCPNEAWTAGEPPRSFWRIAFHALFYTHLYLMPSEREFERWGPLSGLSASLWEQRPDDAAGAAPPAPEALLGYLEWIRSNLPAWLARLDLGSPSSGFPWYPIGKLEHQMVNLRHLGTHIGQLQERLFALGLEPRWVGKA
ncbi:MAG: hypothetical protein N2109_02505 [Fimbriimonadales bacterium]|nr:hypothetical protein [Fimbriimonadales bacterium]